LRTLHSKLLFPAFAGSLGIKVPETRALANGSDVESIRHSSNMLVFKPEYSRFGTATLLRPHAHALRALCPTPEAQWVAQDFIAGEEVCVWVAARGGEVVASVVYKPTWRHGQAASYAFEAINCPAALDVARTLAKACQLTGQLSLDIILTPKGEAIPIECNPRSTSGVHLFDGDAGLARAIMGDGPPVQISRGLRYLWPAMILLGLPRAMRRGDVSRFAADLRRGKDVLTRLGQRLPATGAIFDAARFAVTGLARRKDASRQTTDDIEWNGEPL
jgi:ATP-grasp domain